MLIYDNISIKVKEILRRRHPCLAFVTAKAWGNSTVKLYCSFLTTLTKQGEKEFP
jgi:hypothetical protein